MYTEGHWNNYRTQVQLGKILIRYKGSVGMNIMSHIKHWLNHKSTRKSVQLWQVKLEVRHDYERYDGELHQENHTRATKVLAEDISAM